MNLARQKIGQWSEIFYSTLVRSCSDKWLMVTIFVCGHYSIVWQFYIFRWGSVEGGEGLPPGTAWLVLTLLLNIITGMSHKLAKRNNQAVF